jgi:hypothetical protein
MADGADFEGTFLGESTRKARKVHKCEECWREIQPGEQYRIATWVNDGRVDSMKMCAHCRVASKWLSDNCGGFVYGGVWEDIEEHIEEYRDVYPEVTRDLKRLAVWEQHGWRVKRGPSCHAFRHSLIQGESNGLRYSWLG